MRYTYTSGYEDFQRAARTYIRSTPRRRLVFHFQMWIMLLLGGFLVVFFIITDSGAFGPIKSTVFIAACGLVGGGVTNPLLRPWRMERVYKANNGDPRKPLHLYVALDNDVLILGIEGRSEGQFQRAAICEVAEDEEMLLLFFTKKMYAYIPKRSLPKEAIDAMHQWLAGGVSEC